MDVDPVNQQEIDLLECLIRIDQRETLDERATGLTERLIEAGLVDDNEGGLRLTFAGISRCQSLQHHMASDREAAKILAARGIALAIATESSEEGR
jgi:hypothetical protein